MGIRFPAIIQQRKKILQQRSLNKQHSCPNYATNTTAEVPKGHFAIYVGETYRHRFVIPISFLKHPLFQELLKKAEEEFGYDHPTGGLTIPCSIDAFLNVTTVLNNHQHLGLK